MEQAILTVSLRDYKKSIDDLRASLLSLESTSQEYADIANEIKNRQEKLNEVMSAGKADVDAATNSYNALQQQMSALKKEWKNMEIGTEEWRNMAAEINGLNDKLKEADALTGNYQRNVGDYANAFTQAFDKAAGALGQIPGPLGSVFSTVKQLIPVIKAANTTAVAGLTGVKKAIVATGVGALIVAVGLLVAHWGDLMKLIKGGKSDTERLSEANDELNQKFQEQNATMERQARLWEAQGVATDEIIRRKLGLIRTQISQKRAQLQETLTTYEAIKAHTWLGRVLRGEQGDYKDLEKQIEKVNEELNALVEKEKDLNVDLKVYYENRNSAAAQAAKKEKEEAERIIEELKKKNKTEEQLLKEDYEKKKALLEKYHKDTTALDKQYENDKKSLLSAAAKERMEAEDNLFNANLMGRLQDSSYWADVKKYYEERQKKLNELEREAQYNIKNNNAENDQAKKDKIYKIVTGFDSEADFITAAKSVTEEIGAATNNMIDALNQESVDLNYTFTPHKGTFKELEQAVKNARDYYNAVVDNKKKIGESQQEFNERIRDAFENIVDAEKAVAAYKDTTTELAVAFGQYSNSVTGYSSVSKHLVNELQVAQFSLEHYYEVLKTYLEVCEGEWVDYINSFEEGTPEWKAAIEEKLFYFPEDARSNFLRKLMDVRDAENAIIEERRVNWMSLANEVGNVMGSIADIMDASIEKRKQELIDAGHTEEEANAMLYDQFKAMQDFQIAQAVINTIAGAVGAFMGITRDTGGWGIAAAAIEAAAITAAGIAQIMKIKNTKFGSGTSSLEGGATSYSSVTPRLADYTPDRTANLTSASDQDNLSNALRNTNISVSVTDINNVQNKVKVRQGESQF